MDLVSLIVALVVLGIVMWLVNTQLGQFMAAPFLQIINVIVVIVVVLWILQVFGLWSGLSNVRVGP